MSVGDTTQTSTAPLDGVTVVAVEQAVAAPFATRHLADLGARVIKVERTEGGDFARAYDTVVKGMSTHFVWLNRTKESVAIDLAHPEGKVVLGQLLAEADVFVHNLAPGAIDRLGFPTSELRDEHPELIVAELSGYGHGGPLSERRAFDLLMQAEAGLVSITGTEESPAKCAIPVADIAAGTYLVQGILAALLKRATTGAGAHVEVSLLEAMVEWMGYPMYTAMYGGQPPPRMGIAHPTVVPYDAYPTADGAAVIIAVQNDRGWRSLVADVFDRADLSDDPAFATNAARCANRAEVDGLIGSLTCRLSTAVLLQRLTDAGVAHGTISGVDALPEHPQLLARDRWTSVTSPVGDVRAVLPPATISGAETRLGAVPGHGEHTSTVLSDLGYGESDVKRLREDGVVR